MPKQQTLIPIPSAPSTTNQTPDADSTNSIDLIIEADTYAPYFYKGRREPTPGSQARLVAVLPPEIRPASFRWQIGSSNLTSIAPRVSFRVPDLNREFRVSVTALDGSGKVLANAAELISVSEPEILFYETNSLRGASTVAIGDSLTLIGDEISVKAEPYFFNLGSSLAETTGTWSANGIDLIGNRRDWREIVIRKASSTPAETKVHLSVRSLRNLAQTISGTLTVTLGL